VETLIQLVKTDSSASGKQLLKLLLVVDEAFQPHNYQPEELSDVERQDYMSSIVNKLRKNAFALLGKQKYREAAAVFLLCPTASMIKSAISVLSKQYNQPYLAHLIMRCFEYRLFFAPDTARKLLPMTIIIIIIILIIFIEPLNIINRKVRQIIARGMHFISSKVD
jgi:hypothetical protein